MLGLPSEVRACLFDLDGVLTDTARVHAAAWKEVFDAYLQRRQQQRGEAFVPFDLVADYDRQVDGKPREDGVRSFLSSRGIAIPEGGPADAAGAETIHGLAVAKDELVLRFFKQRGVTAYPGSLAYVRAVRAAELRTAVVSSSRHCREVLEAAGIAALFDVRIDGVLAAQRKLRGKPQPDTFLAAAAALQLRAEQCAVFEDAVAGVEAGKAGGFGLVVGVDRRHEADALREHGADRVVSDLSALLEMT